jgi:lysozyme
MSNWTIRKWLVSLTAGAAATVTLSAFNPTVLEELKDFEGTVLTGYIDIVGEPTIGTGHTNMMGTHQFKVGDTWTAEYADQVLVEDLQVFWDTIDRQVTVPLDDCQLSVLTMWAYNVGTGATGSSTLVRNLNKGDYAGVPKQLMRWDKGRINGELQSIRGLTRRRAAEAKLWETGCAG